MTSKTRNPDRPNGKGWGKGHVPASAKVLTPEQHERKMQRDLAKPVNPVRGPSLTTPRITWEWCAQAMTGRMTSTRRYRMAEAALQQERRGRSHEPAPVVVEPNPEAKSPKKKRS